MKTGCLLLALFSGSFALAQPAANAVQPPNGVEVQIGIASRIGGPSISNYQSSGGVLALAALGRSTPQLLTGIGFFCDTASPSPDTGRFCSNKLTKHSGVFVSAQFGSGSDQTISGYSVGMTYAASKFLRLLVGFSLTPSAEISPGFANAAAQYVSRNQALFPGVSAAKLASNAYGAFDGIAITTTAPASGASAGAVIYYPGPATETHYRGGLLIGVAMPINIFNLFAGNGKNP